MNKTTQFLLMILFIYLIFGLFLFVNQKEMIYFPNNQDFYNCQGFTNYKATEFNGTRFYFKQGDENIIIHYHGNAGSTCDRSIYKSTFEQFNSTIIFVEYSGYSNDSVKPSAQTIKQDVRNINAFILTKNYTSILVFGQSIGSGAASYHTSLGYVDSLILATPFSTLTSLVQSKYIIYPAPILVTEKYNNIDWLTEFDGNLLIIHGDFDSLIPHKFSEELFNQTITQDKEYILISEAGHNNIWSFKEFHNNITQFINTTLKLAQKDKPDYN